MAYDRKRDTKKERRQVDIRVAKREILRVIEDTNDYDILLGVADHLFGKGWEDA